MHAQPSCVMETPPHLPPRPREFIDLRSDDEEEEDARLEPLAPPPPPLLLEPGHFPRIDGLDGFDNIGNLDDLIFGNLGGEDQAFWGAVGVEAQRIPIPIIGNWRVEVPQPVPRAIVPPAAAAPDLPQIFRQAERLNLDPLPMYPVNRQADKDQLNNDNFIPEAVNNQLNNGLLDEDNLIQAEVNDQLRNDQMDNNVNFVSKQINRGRHNPNRPIDLDPPPTEEMENKARCLEGVVDIFPDICLDYIEQLYIALQDRKTVNALVQLILEEEENGKPYPKINHLKRKRPVETDDEEEIMRKYAADRQHNSDTYLTLARGILSEEFSSIPMSFIMKKFHDSGMIIYTTYQGLAEAQRLWDPRSPSYNKLKQARRAKNFPPHIVDQKLSDLQTPPERKRAFQELKDVRVLRAKWETKLEAKRQREAEEAAAKMQHQAEEAANLELSIKEGTMEDCGCCYNEFPRNRMVHCNNESTSHYFCTRCARLHAETQIGSAKYKLQCMSTDVCEAGYSHSQRQLFLDANLTTALDRIEAETVLRLSGIENLATCPFCPYAAEYPPIEHERLFHCKLESCEKVSCRMCQKESHIPKTCEEHAKDIGLDIRREVEEAMTAALVRLCNKCKGPFIKEDGCNKMMCPCGNIQCYVCSRSCDYNHFDDARRGGKAGNCPLFDDVNQRHENETTLAKEIIIEKLRREHPEVAPEDLEIRVSDAVKADEENRRLRRWIPYDRFGFALNGGNGGQEGAPAPHPVNGGLQAYRDEFEARLAAQNANAGIRAPNLQGAAAPAVPAVRPGNRFRFRPFQRRRDPAYQAIYDEARARVLANRRQERLEAAMAAAAGRMELRDRLAARGKDAQKEIGGLVKEEMGADGVAGAGMLAPEPLRRGEDGEAELIYRPGDAVVPRRKAEGWVFEPFGPPGNADAAEDPNDDDDVDADIPAHGAKKHGLGLRNPLLPNDRRPFPFPFPRGSPGPLAPPAQRPNGIEEIMEDFRVQRPWARAVFPEANDDRGLEAFFFEGVPPPWPPLVRGRAGEAWVAGEMAGGVEIGVDGALGNDGGGVKQEEVKQEKKGDKVAKGGRKEGERGLDFLMRLRRGRSKGKKSKDEEKKGGE